MPRLLLLATAIVLVAVAAGGYVLLRPYEYHGSYYDPPYLAGDFSLTDQNGQPFRLADQRGKFVLLFFGYTSCPDVCPATLTQWVRTYRSLGASADRVRFVYITVDPERDTREQLHAYMNQVNPQFYGLWGSPSDLEQVWSDYGVYVEKQPSTGGLGYLVDHSAYTYLLDETGKVKVLYQFGVTADELTADLRHLLG